jgi:hypothetical protein
VEDPLRGCVRRGRVAFAADWLALHSCDCCGP